MKTEEMVKLYTESHLTMRDIGTLAGISHSAVQQRLKKAKISGKDGEMAEAICAYCGKLFFAPRSRVKIRLAMYCCTDHYYMSMVKNPSHIPSEANSRLQRAIVATKTDLSPENFVSALDGNQKNIEIGNLGVFKSITDWEKWEKSGRKAPAPVWRYTK
jgi:phage gp36-like protein